MMLWIVIGSSLLAGAAAGKWIHLLIDERCDHVEGGLRCTERETHLGPHRVTQHGYVTWIKRPDGGK